MHFNSFVKLIIFTKLNTFVSDYQIRKTAFKSQCHQLLTGLIKNFVNISFRFTNCPSSHLGKVLKIAFLKKACKGFPSRGILGQNKLSVWNPRGAIICFTHWKSGNSFKNMNKDSENCFQPTLSENSNYVGWTLEMKGSKNYPILAGGLWTQNHFQI